MVLPECSVEKSQVHVLVVTADSRIVAGNLRENDSRIAWFKGLPQKTCRDQCHREAVKNSDLNADGCFARTNGFEPLNQDLSSHYSNPARQ